MDKNTVLQDLANLIQTNQDQIIAANQKDLALAKDLDPTLVDRLKVDEKKVQGMIQSVEDVIFMADPEGQILYEHSHENGIKIQNRVVPFGKILIIYESRPDVTIEAAISAFKAGNKIYLKGGKEAKHSNLCLVDLWHQALKKNGVSTDYITYLSTNRTETQQLIKENPYQIDLIIPRGGDGLINYVRANTNIPLMVSGRGNNFAYIHEDANVQMAINVILNGKSRLSVCNALDKVLIHQNLPNLNHNLNQLVTALQALGIEVFGTDTIKKEVDSISLISDEAIFYEEFLAPKMVIDLVDTSTSAIQKINQYSGGHSATIICKDTKTAQQFQKEVDCAAVYHNASTRFTDGGQFGLGAEIAISTQKLHFRGPVSLSQLVTNKWFINGTGQTR